MTKYADYIVAIEDSHNVASLSFLSLQGSLCKTKICGQCTLIALRLLSDPEMLAAA